MASNYFLRIDANSGTHEEISNILKVTPTSLTPFWEYSLSESSPLYTRAIDYFLEILESTMPEMEKIGIGSNAITIWYFYEYESQCNMEFSPSNLKRLGDLGLTLCISCWEKG